MIRRSALLAAFLVGCGASDEPLPAACSGGVDDYDRALRAAPEVVRLGTTPLAECVRRSTSDAELVTIGATLTTVGEELEEHALEGSATAAVRLGYLIGATTRAAADTEGIHAELVHRLERSGAAVVGAGVAASAQQALQRGIAAGGARG
ncbi:MAG: hypothetical protein JHC95_01125 [Solirubrobacteraceae bacterium]|nr:hypothetical protein [Solirubrobacteraceae bacterium]